VSTTPFKLINRSESQRLCDRLSLLAKQWADEWLHGLSGVPQATAGPQALPDSSWTVRQRTAEVAAAVGLSTSAASSLRRCLTGIAESTDDAVLHEVDDAAVSSLLQLLLGTGECGNGEVPTPQAVAAPGSGYVSMKCRFDDGFELDVLLWPKTVEAWLSEAAAKTSQKRVSVSRLDALDSQTVTIDVVAGEAEIAFEEFRSLCAGVVIKLDRRLDQPLHLRLAGEGVVCSGHLGVNDDRRAVQVVTTG
jgi:flagellar motor switch/type III secretory pathway protein FliN